MVTRIWRVVADNFWLIDGYSIRNPRAIPTIFRLKRAECEFHSTGKWLDDEWLFYITWKVTGETVAMYTLGSKNE